MNNGSAGYWRIADNILGFDGLEGFVIPPADSIYAAVFENTCSAVVTEADAAYLAGRWQFSKYPAELEMVLRRAANDRFAVECLLEARTGTGQTQNIAWPYPADHIMIGDTWYPLLPDQLLLMEKVFSSADIPATGTLLPGRYRSLMGLSADFIRNELSFATDLLPAGEEPPPVKAVLYPYQIKGWQWLCFMWQERIGGILADEMGLGKTLQIIALIDTGPRAGLSPALIIGTATILENWRREFVKFAPELSTHVHQGPGRTGFPSELRKFDVVITSYDTVVRDSSLFRQIKWTLVVCDEAQAIKNPGSARTQAIKALSRQAGFAVTGTPVENSLTDLWSLMDFAVPGFLGSQPAFTAAYRNTPEDAARLEALISPLILRRTVAEVAADLPPKLIIPQALELSDEEMSAYELIRHDAEKAWQAGRSLTILTRLRMFCTHPFLVEDRPGEDPAVSSSKYARLTEIVEEIVENRAKLLLFTSYQQMNDMLVKDFRKRFGIYTASVDGRTPVPDRQKIIDDFSRTEGAAALVLNPAAAGTGLNITAASHVIHYNPEWNPAKEDQATARAHRHGQDRPVTVHRLFYSGTIEEVIEARLERKRQLAGTAIVGIQGDDDDYNDILQAVTKSPVK